MPVQLSGYLPPLDHNGLTAHEEEYVTQFEQAYAEADGHAQLIPVVGLLRIVSVRHRANPEENPPTVELRFAAIEPATTAATQKMLRKALDQAVEKRTGVTPLPFED